MDRTARLIDGMRLCAMDRRDKRPLVDPKVFELAEHFLSDLEGDKNLNIGSPLSDAAEQALADGSATNRGDEA